MTTKVFGALLIIAGSGGIGYALVLYDRRQEQAMAELQKCLQWMIWQLGYQMPPLAQLCRGAARNCKGRVGQVFHIFADELQHQVLPDPSICMREAIGAVKYVPERAAAHLGELGMALGQFDLQNQLASLEALETQCRLELEHLRSGRERRTRNYQTLSLCAGAVLVILLL